MRPFVALLSVLALMPFAAAALDGTQGDHTVGPCRVAWRENFASFWGNYELVACSVAGQEVLYVYDADTYFGHVCAYRVAGQTVRQCSTAVDANA